MHADNVNLSKICLMKMTQPFPYSLIAPQLKPTLALWLLSVKTSLKLVSENKENHLIFFKVLSDLNSSPCLLN